MTEWKPVYRYKNADPDRVREELDALPRCEPKTIVAMAGDDSRESHKCFEWDDTKAGEAYRIWQARQLVENLVVAAEITDAETKETMAVYVNYMTSVENGEGRKYVPTLSQDEDLKDKMFSETKKAFQIAATKYNTYKALFSAEQVSELKEVIQV